MKKDLEKMSSVNSSGITVPEGPVPTKERLPLPGTKILWKLFATERQRSALLAAENEKLKAKLQKLQTTNLRVAKANYKEWQRSASLEEENKKLRAEVDSSTSRVVQANTIIRSANGVIAGLKQEKAALEGGKTVRNEACAVLGLDPNTAFAGQTEEEIKMSIESAYRRMARVNHTDIKGKSTEEKMKAINNARDNLLNPATRGAYTH